MSRPRLKQYLKIWRMLRPRVIETQRFRGCRDRTHRDSSKGVETESLATHWSIRCQNGVWGYLDCVRKESQDRSSRNLSSWDRLTWDMSSHDRLSWNRSSKDRTGRGIYSSIISWWGGVIKLAHLGKMGKKTGTLRHFTLFHIEIGKILHFRWNYGLKRQ